MRCDRAVLLFRLACAPDRTLAVRPGHVALCPRQPDLRRGGRLGSGWLSRVLAHLPVGRPERRRGHSRRPAAGRGTPPGTYRGTRGVRRAVAAAARISARRDRAAGPEPARRLVRGMRRYAEKGARSKLRPARWEGCFGRRLLAVVL